jgi:hypothetical protein
MELKRTYTFITFSLEWCATVRTNILQTNPDNCLVEALKKKKKTRLFRTSLDQKAFRHLTNLSSETVSLEDLDEFDEVSGPRVLFFLVVVV